MRKLILAAIGFAAWRWLNARSKQSSSYQDDSRETETRTPPRRPSSPPRRPTPQPASSASSLADEIPEKQGRAGKVTYRVVEHDGGWAYKVGDVYSETYGSHDAAREAAERAARAQEMAGDAEPIEYQDETGQWHVETADGQDRPATGVEDTQPRMG
jgi:hypothetical protein